MLFSTIYCKHRAAAQRNQPCTKQQGKYVLIRAPQRKRAGRVGERQHVVEYLQLAVYRKRTTK